MSEIQKKTERVRVLEIQVDPLRVDRAVYATGRLLEKHKFAYIVFVNTSSALAGLDGTYLEHAALVLPGDRNIEEAAELRGRLEDDKSYQAEYFRRLLGRLNRQGASIYLAMEEENELLKLRQIIKERYKWLTVRESLWEEDISIDSKINDINSFAPDVLLICGHHDRIKEFMKEHGCKIHAGICLCLETVATDAESNISDWMKGSRLQKAYMEVTSRISGILHNFLFRKKMKAVAQEEPKEVREGEEEQDVAEEGTEVLWPEDEEIK